MENEIYYGNKINESSEVTVTLAGKVVKCYLSVTTDGAYGKIVWLMMKNCNVHDDVYPYYIAGIQSDGSLIRAHGLTGTILPIDQRDAHGKVAIRKQKKVEVQLTDVENNND